MPSNRRGTSTAFCALAVSSQSETTPSTWRTENHTVNKVSDDNYRLIGHIDLSEEAGLKDTCSSLFYFAANNKGSIVVLYPEVY